MNNNIAYMVSRSFRFVHVFARVEKALWYGRPDVSIFAKIHSLSLKLIRCR